MKQAHLIILMYVAIIVAVVYHSPTNAQTVKPTIAKIKVDKVIMYDNGCFDAKNGGKTVVRCI